MLTGVHAPAGTADTARGRRIGAEKRLRYRQSQSPFADLRRPDQELGVRGMARRESAAQCVLGGGMAHHIVEHLVYVPGDHVSIGLAPSDESSLAVFHHDYGRARIRVVLARHGQAISA